MYPSLIAMFVITFILVRVVIALAPRVGLVDIPNERSVHTHTVPRGGGIGIFFALIAVCVLFDFSLVLQYPMTFSAFAMIFVIGILDDLHNASPRTKFIVIFIAATLSYMEGIGIHTLGTYFGYEFSLGWFALPFTLFAVSGFTNALNLIDGLDGLSGSISIVILAVLFSIGYRHHDSFITVLSALMIMGILAFLYYNWNPAKIFLGDSGSLTVGFVISILSVKALDYIHPAVIFFLAAIPILDTLIVMVRRKRQGLSAFAPDKTHLHHILLQFFGGNVKRAVISLTLLQIIYSMTALVIMEDIEQTYVLLLFAVNFVLFYLISSTMLINQQRIDNLEEEVHSLKEGHREQK